MKGKADLVALEVCSLVGCFELTLWPCPQECIASGFSAHLAASFSQYFRNSGAALGLFVMYEFIFFFYFIFKLYITVLDLPNIKMNPPQVYMCSPS